MVLRNAHRTALYMYFTEAIIKYGQGVNGGPGTHIIFLKKSTLLKKMFRLLSFK